jgi:galactokinase
VPLRYAGSPLEAVNRANEVLRIGSARVMGGGLVGSIICFVPDSEFAAFKKHMVGYYGEDKVIEVSIPPLGAHEVK